MSILKLYNTTYTKYPISTRSRLILCRSNFQHFDIFKDFILDIFQLRWLADTMASYKDNFTILIKQIRVWTSISFVKEPIKYYFPGTISSSLFRFVSCPVDCFCKRNGSVEFQIILLMPWDINKDRITKQVMPLYCLGICHHITCLDLFPKRLKRPF